MTLNDISRLLGVGWDCVKSIIKRHLAKRYARVDLSGLEYIAPDEISIKKGHRYLTLFHKWVKQLKESATGIFCGEIKTEEAKKEKQLQVLHAKIGQLTVERDFLAKPGGSGERLPQAKHGRFWPCEAQRCAAVRFAWHSPFRPVLRKNRGGLLGSLKRLRRHRFSLAFFPSQDNLA